MPAIFRKIWKWLAAGMAGVVILLAILLGLFRLMLPQVPAYHAQIEQWASRAMGLPVQIERIDARWGLDGPELRFSKARVLAPSGELPLIEADTGSVSISVLEWLRSREIRTDRVRLDGTRLSIVRSTDGRYYLHGLEVDRPGEFSVDLIPDGRFELGNVEVTLQGLINQGDPWSFVSPSTTIEKDGNKLTLAGRVDLPGNLGEALEFSGEIFGDLGGNQDLQWQAYVQGENVNLAGWRELFPNTPYVPAGGEGEVELTLAFEGSALQEGSANLDLIDVRPPGAAEDDPGYESLMGRFQLERNGGAWRGTASDLRIGSGQRLWPPTSVSLEWSREEGARQTYMDASFLRLEDLTPFAQFLPADEGRALLQELDPVGDLHGLVVHHQDEEGIVSYTVQSELDQVGFSAARGWPGVGGITGLLRSSEQGGRLQIDSGEMSVDIPALFNQALTLRAAAGPLVWQNSAEGMLVSSDGLELQNADFRGRFIASLNLPADADSPSLELTAVLQDVDISQARHYVPAKKMSPKVADWLDQAFVAGRIPEAKVSFNGPLNAFPFDQGEGLFATAFSVEGATLNYGRTWPSITGLYADVEFKNAGVTLTGKRGTTAIGGQIHSGVGRIPDLRVGELEIQGTATAELSELMEFLRASPLTDFFGPKLGEIDVHGGQGELKVDFQFPLRHMHDRRVEVNVGIQNGAMGLRAVPHRLEAIAGDISFVDDKVVAHGVAARMFQQPVGIEIGPGAGPQGGTLATMTGWIDAENVVTELGLPLEGKLEGETVWQTRALFSKSEGAGIDLATISVESSLQGMSVSLPSPFQKSHEETVPLNLDFTLGYGDSVDLRANWGADVEARFQLRERSDSWRLERGAVQFGEGKPRLPITEGVVVRGAVDTLPVDEWLDLKRGRGASGWRLADYLNAVTLQVSELRAMGYRFPSVELSLNKASREWIIQVDSGTVDGTLFVPFDVPGELPLVVDMERLYLNEADGSESEFGDPRELPGLTIAVEDFMLGGRKFGRIHVEGARTPQGLDFQRLSTEAESFSIQGSGSWLVDDTGPQTRLDLELVSSDVLLTLSDLGYGNSIEASSGQAIFNVYWPGAPGADFLPRVSGNVTVAVEDGQLNDVEPGAGRVFGLLSVSALPRRLGLDFRDVFRKGFRFDDIRGDFVLDQGNAYTANLRLDGPAAAIGVAGRAGLASRDYDQTAVVSAKVGKTLPVAGALVAGAGVGAALLLFSEIFKKPLRGMAQAHYRISGSWDDPNVERVLARDLPEEEEVVEAM